MEHTINLGICRQAIMKLDSVNVDIHEMLEDDDIKPETRDTLEKMADIVCVLEATLTNMASEEIGEDEFLSEEMQMDEIDPYPVAEMDDILNEEI